MQIDFQGHVFNPRWTYRYRIDASNGGTVASSYIWVGYTTASGGLTVRAGQLKPEFLQMERVSPFGQIAIERPYTNEYFTTDISKGIQFITKPSDRLSVVGTIHNGSYSYRSDYNNLATEIAFAGQASWVALADDPAAAFSQFGDAQQWDGDQDAVMLGLGVDYELGRRADTNYPDLVKWTADANAELGGASLHGSVIGQHFTAGNTLPTGVPANIATVNQYGFIGQIGYMVLPNTLDAFVRYDLTDFDNVYYRLSGGTVGAPPADRVSMLTVGVNRFIRKNNARLTLDVVHSFDPVPVADTGIGVLQSGEGNQTAVRAQMQVRF
jgi:hypothetical protein